MKIFCHHIYEYRKGLRNLILHTMSAENRDFAERKLAHHTIDYLIHEISDGKINIYFGNPACVKVVRAINKPKLADLTPEEDFMLGQMLGYGVLQQCERFLCRVHRLSGMEARAG